jgi:hypothetical protein
MALLEAHIDGAELALEGRALPEIRTRAARSGAVTLRAAAARYVEERRAVWTQHTLARYESTLRQTGEHVIAKLAKKSSP